MRPASLLTPGLGREAFGRAGPRAALRTACIPLRLALSASVFRTRAGNEERQTICFKVLLPSHAACSQASHTTDWSQLRAGGQAQGGRCIALHRYQLGQLLWPEPAGQASPAFTHLHPRTAPGWALRPRCLGLFSTRLPSLPAAQIAPTACLLGHLHIRLHTQPSE